MKIDKRLDKVFLKANKINIDDDSKIVIMSDIHRGSGDSYDNFVHNENIYEAALNTYYDNGFKYVELGDGDDMWEVKNYKDIINGHLNTFKLLKKFNDENRLLMIYGNHDMCKKNKTILKNNFYSYKDIYTKKESDLLNDLQVYESVILNYNGNDIFLLHGHQVDLLNSTLWRLSRFLVRNIWRPLERFGLKDPTSAAKNYKGTKSTDKKLEKWSNENKKIVIAGHTHKPIYPLTGESYYFNDGSAIHPNGITCIEIENGKIALVKWSFKLKKDNLISVGKEVIAGFENIKDFFN